MFASESFENLPNEPATLPKKQNFDYAALEDNTRLFVQERTKDIKEWERSLKQAAWEIGRNLVEVRECLTALGYGLFTSWLRSEFQWSEKTAYNYIAIYEFFPTSVNVTEVEIAISSLYLLASPSIPEEARMEVRRLAEQGKKITSKEVKSVVARHKQPTKPRVVEQITVKAEAETVERELPVVTPIRHAYSQSDRQEVSDSTFIEFDEKEPTRYATPQPLGIVGNYAVEDEEQDKPELVEEGLVTEITLPKLSNQVNQSEDSSLEVQGEYFETSTQSQQVERTQTIFSASEKNKESSEAVISIEQHEQEFEGTTSQTALEKIYSFLISAATEYLPNLLTLRFSEVDNVIKQIAQDSKFGALTKSEQLTQEQVEEIWQPIAPYIPAKSLSFYDWSSSELETFVQKALAELEQRQKELLAEEDSSTPKQS